MSTSWTLHVDGGRKTRVHSAITTSPEPLPDVLFLLFVTMPCVTRAGVVLRHSERVPTGLATQIESSTRPFETIGIQGFSERLSEEYGLRSF